MLKPVYGMPRHAGYRGFSLIELMLAMLIGIIIIGGVMSLYISTRNTQRTSEDQLQMIADARFVVNTIAYDLRHAGYWGEADVNTSIVCRLGDAACLGTGSFTGSNMQQATGDCFDFWYIDIERPVTATDNVTTYANTCTSQAYKPGTDVLGVHYVDSNTVASSQLAAGITYLRSNYMAGGLFLGTPVPPSSLSAYDGLRYWDDDTRSKNRRLIAHVYYVSSETDGVAGRPSLHRVELQAGPVMTDAVLIPGVVDLQFQYGVDTNSPMDNSANSYVSVGKIPKDAAGNPLWARVRTVKIWVLMRTERKDRDGITGAQTFTLANNAPVTYNNGYRHYLLTGIVQLRNTRELDVKAKP